MLTKEVIHSLLGIWPMVGKELTVLSHLVQMLVASFPSPLPYFYGYTSQLLHE